MAVSFGSKPTGYNSADGLNQEAVGATSVSAAAGFSVHASANLLIGQLAFGNGASVAAPTGVTMTWAGASMTQEVITSSTSMPNTATSAQYSKASPTTGSNTLAAAWTTAQDCYMSAVAFIGAQTNGTTNITQATALAIPTTSDGGTVACFAVNGSTPTVDQTKIWAEAPNNPGGGGSYAIGGTTSNTHNFTGAGGTRQVITGVTLSATGGAAVFIKMVCNGFRLAGAGGLAS